MQSSIRTQAILVLLLALASGCSAITLQDGFHPPPGSSLDRGRIEELEVGPGGDARPLRGRSSIGPGFLALLPLFPYGHQRISPEFVGMATSLTTQSLLSDLVNVVVADLRTAGVAERVVMEGVDLQNLGADPQSGPAPYELKLTLDEGIYHRNLTLYGISFAGAFLWMIGLPTSYGSADLAFTAELFDPGGHSLGKQSFEASSRATEWLYWPFQPAYSRAMPRAYEEISARLRRFVSTTLEE